MRSLPESTIKAAIELNHVRRRSGVVNVRAGYSLGTAIRKIPEL
jgi:hypothetical protein